MDMRCELLTLTKPSLPVLYEYTCLVLRNLRKEMQNSFSDGGDDGDKHSIEWVVLYKHPPSSVMQVAYGSFFKLREGGCRTLT